jgi:hypothetical protein
MKQMNVQRPTLNAQLKDGIQLKKYACGENFNIESRVADEWGGSIERYKSTLDVER